jgi:serine/threonine protein kinase
LLSVPLTSHCESLTRSLQVLKVRRKADGGVFACKEINYGKMSEKEKELLVSEVNILRELRHPNIVKYVNRIIDKAQTKVRSPVWPTEWLACSPKSRPSALIVVSDSILQGLIVL